MTKAQKILAFDTAMGGCSAAFYDTDRAHATALSEPMARGHAERLVPMIQSVLETAGSSFDAIDSLVTTVGPGAFAGLRIGLSTARALGLALGKPVIGVTTLAALAAAFFDQRSLEPTQTLCVLVETKRSDFYVQLFSSDNIPLHAPQARPAEDILAGFPDTKNTIIIGDGAPRFCALFPEESLTVAEGFSLPDPTVMARLSLARDSHGLCSARPLYLRDADVSRPKNAPRILCDDQRYL